ncbi:MAG: hypothetical protein ABIM20_01650 [candidate division WOR-3 bacterium]
MDRSLKVKGSGLLKFSTSKGKYLFNILKRTIYRLNGGKMAVFVPTIALDPRPFNVPTIELIENILNSKLNQLVLNFTERCNLR